MNYQTITQGIRQHLQDGLGAIAFYTCIPVPWGLQPQFQRVARWAPLVGLGVGLGLASVNGGLVALQMPPLMRSVVIVGLWVALTGGLHLDGAMDAADGLAVMDPHRRLEVMADSRTGAFGVMVALFLVLLKVTAFASMDLFTQTASLPLAAGWGRWGQQVAIAQYPYLKPTGKGAFHKAALPHWRACLPGLLILIGSHGLWAAADGDHLWTLGSAGVGMALAIAIAHWFYHRFRGHTGDTYGAVVEWTEAFFLVSLTVIRP